MPSDTFLQILRCPDDRSELAPADLDLVARINARIASGRIVTRGGRPLDRPIDAGLVRASGDVLYPIVDGIPRLLIHEGVSLSQLEPPAGGE